MNNRTLSVFISNIILALFGDVICFGLNWLIAKFIVTPIIGVQVCFALNTVFNTTVFTEDIMPVLYATACFIVRILFKSKLKIEEY